MGPIGGGHVCLQANSSGSEVFQLRAGPSSRSSQCLQPGLEPVCRVCKPSMVSNIVSISKGSQRQGQSHFGSFSVANTTVVPSDTSTTVQCSMSTSQERDDVVISPSQREFIMPTRIPQLAVWPLSGNSASQEAFQQMLLGCSQHPGETRPPHLMNPSSKSGTAGVWKGAEIPLGVL